MSNRSGKGGKSNGPLLVPPLPPQTPEDDLPLQSNTTFKKSSTPVLRASTSFISSDCKRSFQLQSDSESDEKVASKKVQCTPQSLTLFTISECNEESFCQDGAIGGFSPPSRSLDLVVGTCLLL